MAIGTDQGGSLRKPFSNCGVVALKLTWGLVLYTRCLGLEAGLDHAGPVPRTVQDCATLLEVIAGNDGIDNRQPYIWHSGRRIPVRNDGSERCCSFKICNIKLGGTRCLSEGNQYPVLQRQRSDIDGWHGHGAYFRVLFCPFQTLLKAISHS